MLKTLTVLILASVSSIQALHSREPKNYAYAQEKPYLQILKTALETEKPAPTNGNSGASEQANVDSNGVSVISLPPKDTFDKASVFINGGLFVIGFSGIFVAILTLVNFRKSSERQLRAYLSVGVGGAVYQERDKGTPFGALPILMNSGQTPAYRVHWAVKAAIFPKELPAGQVLSEIGENSGQTIVGIHQTFNLHANVIGFVQDDEVEDIKSNNRDKALYTWGIVHYEDAFGNKRFTRFCHRLMWLPEGGNVYGYYVPNRNEAD